VFCRRDRSLTVAALILLALPSGCRHASPGGVTRLAVLPVENLTGDPSLDWVAAAAPGVIASQLAPTPEMHAFPVGALREAYAARATQVLQSHLTAAGGGLRLVSVLEDLGRHRTARTLRAEGAGRDGVLGLLGQVSRALSGRARPFPTTSLEALRLLTLAQDVADFERAAAADPDFGQTYLAWAQWLAGRGERQEASRVLGAAQARGERIAPIERAEIAALAASIAGDGNPASGRSANWPPSRHRMRNWPARSASSNSPPGAWNRP
jgi:hypothetical protein